MARLTNLEAYAAQRTEETRRRQAEYAEQHIELKRLRGEPSRRDVAAALLDIYLCDPAAPVSSHAALVAVLEDRGYTRIASLAFIRRLVERMGDYSI